ncbi:hypothetical protein HY085_01975 [Candidatus Gottesmanbacteria bacterium]|nr:hypothetical protein [Candidatus Gottesmanbacteria bacterium]
MPKGESATPEINLLSGDGGVGGKFLRWALTWGKRIVILTELVVILAFLSRFYLDTKAADLSEKINQKKAIVLASAEFEKKFRAAVAKIDKAKAIENKISLMTVYDAAKTLIPADIAVDQISISDLTVSFTGKRDDPALAKLVAGFTGSKNFKDISVDRVSKTGSASGGLDFSFKATYGR